MPLKIIEWYLHSKKANYVLRHYSEILSVSGSEIDHFNMFLTYKTFVINLCIYDASINRSKWLPASE